MRRLRAALVLGVLAAGCGGGEEGRSSGLSGAALVRESGCLACHRLGPEGKKAPGKALTRVGARRSRARIRKSLVDPPEGMPSYDSLPRRDFNELVRYLARRR